MTIFCLLCMVSSVTLALPAVAGELDKIDRTIAKQPAYQTRSPKYCLLVLGPEAKTRVWLVLDGNALFIDRNGNGDLTEKGERVEIKKSEDEADRDGFRQFAAGDVLEADGKTRHDIQVMAFDEPLNLTVIYVTTDGKRAQVAGDPSSPERLQLTGRPQEAPIIHIGGPLTLRLAKPRQVTLNKPAELYVQVGTPGVGKGSFAAVVHGDDNPALRKAAGQPPLVPEGVHPIVDIEFPAKSTTEPTPRVHVELRQRC